MSEGTQSSTWHGIPIGEARAGRFIDAVNTFHSMRKLRVNNREITFADQNDGYVKMDGGYLNWLFGSPLGAFDSSDFYNKTVSEFFDIVIDYVTNNYVKSWEEFAVFLTPKVSMINSIFSMVSSAEISAPGMNQSIPIANLPNLVALQSFSQLVIWIKSILPNSMLILPATIMQANNNGGEYSFGVTLEFSTEVQGMEHAAMSFTFMI